MGIESALQTIASIFIVAGFINFLTSRKKPKTLKRTFVYWATMFIGSILILYALSFAFTYLPIIIVAPTIVIILGIGLLAVIIGNILIKSKKN